MNVLNVHLAFKNVKKAESLPEGCGKGNSAFNLLASIAVKWVVKAGGSKAGAAGEKQNTASVLHVDLYAYYYLVFYLFPTLSLQKLGKLKRN